MTDDIDQHSTVGDYVPLLRYDIMYKDAIKAKSLLPECAHAAMDDLIEAYRLAAEHVSSEKSELVALDNISIQNGAVWDAIGDYSIICSLNILSETPKMLLDAENIIKYGEPISEVTLEEKDFAGELWKFFEERDKQNPRPPPPTNEEIVEDALRDLFPPQEPC